MRPSNWRDQQGSDYKSLSNAEFEKIRSKRSASPWGSPLRQIALSATSALLLGIFIGFKVNSNAHRTKIDALVAQVSTIHEGAKSALNALENADDDFRTLTSSLGSLDSANSSGDLVRLDPSEVRQFYSSLQELDALTNIVRKVVKSRNCECAGILNGVDIDSIERFRERLKSLLLVNPQATHEGGPQIRDNIRALDSAIRDCRLQLQELQGLSLPKNGQKPN